MAEYEIHKGVGRGPEFKGLRGPYLFLFAGGLLFDVLLIVVCRLAGMSTAAYLTLGLAVGAGATALTFRLNAVYGEHGLMKRVARCRRPRRIASRRSVMTMLHINNDTYGNILKTATLESKLPLLAVENDYLLSKDADITAAFAVLLPELYTLSAEEYEALHEA